MAVDRISGFVAETAATTPALAKARAEMAQGKGAEAARNFESVFLTQMVDQMMKTVKLGGFDGGHAEETWRSFLARAIADQIADTGTTGIAQSVERALNAYKDPSS